MSSRAQVRHFARAVEERKGDRDLPLLSVSNYRGVIRRSEITADEPRADDLSAYRFCAAGDIVINRMSAYQGALGRAKEDGVVSPDYLVLRLRKGIDSSFTEYLFKSHSFVSEMAARVRGIGSASLGTVRTPRINWTDLGAIEIDLPNDIEQRQIAEYLDRETGKIDELITKQEQLVATLTERRQAVIAQAVTRGLDRNVPTRDTGIEWIGCAPAAWSYVPLKWRARLQTGGTPKCAEPFADDGVQWLRPDDLNVNGHPSISARSLSSEGAAELRSSRAGSTLVCGIGATLGKAGIVAGASYSNQQITAVDSVLNDRFIFHVLTAAKLAIVALSVGNTLPIINNDRLGMLPVPVPPEMEQAEIANFIDQTISGIDLMLEKSETLIETLRERRAALISAAVTGKIDVRGL